MSQNYCPIFDAVFEARNGALRSIGIWALRPDALDLEIEEFAKTGQASAAFRAELLFLADPTMEMLTKANTRRVPNTSTDVGNGVRFENGVFIMIGELKAPNEEPWEIFNLQDYDGVPILKRFVADYFRNTGQNLYDLMSNSESSLNCFLKLAERHIKEGDVNAARKTLQNDVIRYAERYTQDWQEQDSVAGRYAKLWQERQKLDLGARFAKIRDDAINKLRSLESITLRR